jgi:hypothetical protein
MTFRKTVPDTLSLRDFNWNKNDRRLVATKFYNGISASGVAPEIIIKSHKTGIEHTFGLVGTKVTEAALTELVNNSETVKEKTTSDAFKWVRYYRTSQNCPIWIVYAYGIL